MKNMMTGGIVPSETNQLIDDHDQSLLLRKLRGRRFIDWYKGLSDMGQFLFGLSIGLPLTLAGVWAYAKHLSAN